MIHTILLQCTGNLPSEVISIIESYWIGTVNVYSNSFAFAIHIHDGNIITCGHNGWGGDNSSISNYLKTHEVQQIYHNDCTFFAVLSNRTVVQWGSDIKVNAIHFIDATSTVSNRYTIVLISADRKLKVLGKKYKLEDTQRIVNVRKVVASCEAFAVIFGKSQLFVFGHSEYGGYIHASALQQINAVGVDYVVSNDAAFVACLHNQKNVICWGNAKYGGTSTISNLKNKTIIAIFNTSAAFAIIYDDGTILAWGHPDFGGQLNMTSDTYRYERIYASNFAFVAISRCQKRIKAWGAENMFGFKIVVPEYCLLQVYKYGVHSVYSTSAAFLLILYNGDFVTFGDIQQGGFIDDKKKQLLRQNIGSVYSNYGAFAIKCLKDSSLVVWGNIDSGGAIDYSLHTYINKVGVDTVYSTKCAFAAKLLDGNVITWGSKIYGGGFQTKL